MYSSSGGGLLSLFKNISLSSFLDGTSKTLSVINQAIPIIYQIKPIVGNVQSLFKISNILNAKEPVSTSSSKLLEAPQSVSKVNDNASPVFFV